MIADPDLIAGWVHARSIARGVAMPVDDHGGWRVDTRSDVEWGRYIFAAPGAGLAELGQTIDRPNVFLKVCSDDATLRALLPRNWEMQAPSWLMTGPPNAGVATLPDDYRQVIDRNGEAIRIRILARDDTVAASGHAAEAQGVFVFDRIGTAAAHRRRGLGRVVMNELAAQRRLSASRFALVATAEGRALYTMLGWQVHAPYASAVITDRAS